MNFTRVELFKNIPFDVDYRNTIDFDTEVLQNQFFNSSEFSEDKKVINDALYIDYTKGIFRVAGSQGQLYDYNYMRYKNADRDKWYYAFILSKRYLSDGSTELTFSIDVIQTFMFNYNIAPCFIERGHVKRYRKSKTSNSIVPTIFDNDLNSNSCRNFEDIDTNIYTYTSRKDINIDNVAGLKWVFITCNKPFTISEYNESNLIPNTYTFIYPITISNKEIYINNEKVYLTLKELTSYNDLMATVVSINISNFCGVSYNVTTDENSIRINSIHLKKVYTSYPSNPGIAVYYAENLFTGYFNTNVGFKLMELLGSNLDIVPIIKNDPNSNKNIDMEYKLQFAPYTYISIGTKSDAKDYKLNYIAKKGTQEIESLKYNMFVQSMYGYTDTYSLYLEYLSEDSGITQHKLNSYVYSNTGIMPIYQNQLELYMQNRQPADALSATLSTLLSSSVSISAKNAFFAAAGSLSQINSLLSTKIEAANSPDNVVLKTDGFSSWFFNDDVPFVCKKTIPKAHKQTCWDFLYKYGYKVGQICNDIKSFFKTRYWFNYIKTLDAEIENSSIDTSVFEEQIKGIYNSGITFWHYNNGNYKFCEYDKENVERAIM